MYPYGHAWEKLYVAVQCLIGPGDIKPRLDNAYWSALFPRLLEDEFPEDLYEEYLGILEALRVRKEPGGEGAHRPLDAMSEEQARELAERIFSLFNQVAERHYGREGR